MKNLLSLLLFLVTVTGYCQADAAYIRVYIEKPELLYKSTVIIFSDSCTEEVDNCCDAPTFGGAGLNSTTPPGPGHAGTAARNEDLRAVAAEHALPLLDLAAFFQALGEPTAETFRDPIHPNEAFSLAIARALADAGRAAVACGAAPGGGGREREEGEPPALEALLPREEEAAVAPPPQPRRASLI